MNEPVAEGPIDVSSVFLTDNEAHQALSDNGLQLFYDVFTPGDAEDYR